ncbi:uncharacterized protein LOC120092664 isoform X2 [Benincasa hispida]|uniref:uncharacterized protein LOC120092664 isoform X2 n=1 Tax=Benincasa hispida TaxID=102211 RepID=UPI0019000C49|nr:uncharacterized protein LOC120092664 isoform X2 [Benincasa hispida]
MGTNLLVGHRSSIVFASLQILKSLNRQEEEMADSVIAICISSVPFQPYISLAAIISGLSYEGLQGLLGLTHTAGTVPDVLPPPRLTLLSSFVLPYKPEFIGILEPYMQDGHLKGWKQ